MALVASGACSHSSEKCRSTAAATSQIHRRHMRIRLNGRIIGGLVKSSKDVMIFCRFAVRSLFREEKFQEKPLGPGYRPVRHVRPENYAQPSYLEWFTAVYLFPCLQPMVSEEPVFIVGINKNCLATTLHDQ